MHQVRPLHKDICLRAKLVHGAGFEQRPFLTRNEGYIWRVRSYDYVISIHLLYDLLEKCLSGRRDVSGRLRNTAAKAVVVHKLCPAHVTTNALGHVAKLRNEQRLNTFGMMEDLRNVTFQRFVLGNPFRGRDLGVLDANVIETYGHKWVFLCNRR